MNRNLSKAALAGVSLVIFAASLAVMEGVAAATPKGGAGVTSIEPLQNAEALMRAGYNPAPTCVKVKVDPAGALFQSVWITNNCPATQRVKSVWAYAGDSDCYVMKPSTKVEDHHILETGRDRWDGLVSC